ncbi:hypothetical protein OIU77_014880 [Salix suchowensis]|uniref:Uncharacterized protein n=1 Tax=Salix suchowensis TaxID=1278906 RepID=A0ABQ8ZYT8_9ROSI|nr:hypothetical protein OIU77_014880 [Salix suchowensis]
MIYYTTGSMASISPPRKRSFLSIGPSSLFGEHTERERDTEREREREREREAHIIHSLVHATLRIHMSL